MESSLLVAGTVQATLALNKQPVNTARLHISEVANGAGLPAFLADIRTTPVWCIRSENVEVCELSPVSKTWLLPVARAPDCKFAARSLAGCFLLLTRRLVPSLLLQCGICLLRFRANLLRGGQPRALPSSTEGHDELHGGGCALDFDLGQDLLSREQDVLFGDHVNVGVEASFVALRFQIESNSGGFDRLVLLLNLLGEDAESSQGVFHLLEGSEHGLAVRRPDSRCRWRRTGGRWRDAVRHRRSVSETEGPTDQTRLGQSKRCFEGRAFKSSGCGEGQVGIVSGVGDADLGVGGGHGALGGGDIRTALEKLRGQADWNGWRRSQQRLGGNRKVRGCLADQSGDRMLVLGARNAEIGGQRLRALQGGLRLDDGNSDPKFPVSY